MILRLDEPSRPGDGAACDCGLRTIAYSPRIDGELIIRRLHRKPGVVLGEGAIEVDHHLQGPLTQGAIREAAAIFNRKMVEPLAYIGLV